MNYREENINRQLVKQGINLATLKKADIPCVICQQFTLLRNGQSEAVDGGINYKYICSDRFCNCQYSLAVAR
jgi:hypothetical protein